MGLDVKIPGNSGRLTPGAGRILDFSWPAKFATPADAGALGNPGCFSRNGDTISADNTSVGTIVGTGSETYQARVNGMPFIFYTSTNHLIDNGFIRSIDAMTMFPNLAAQATEMGDFSGINDFQCWRVVAALAIQRTPASFARDCGLQFTTGALKGIVTNKPAGFGFCMTAADTMSLVWAGGGVIRGSRPVRQTSVADLAIYHSYEVRLIGATVSSNAKLKVYVDGVLVLVLDWVLDNLPYPDSGAVFGFNTSIINNGGGDLLLAFPFRVRFMAAPTEEALL